MKKIFSAIEILKFVLPILLWVFLFRDYFRGHPAMTRHGIDYYHLVKYFMENLFSGVFPQWDPYRGWGKPEDIDNRFIGEFNPFHLVYSFFCHLGVPLAQAFLCYGLSYFLSGAWGFYLLAKRILGHKELAWVSFVLLLFSSVVFTVFNNFCIMLLFVPIVWFFYFLIGFCQEPKKHFFLGLTFSTMIILITYMPFFFITIFVVCTGGFVVLYPETTKDIFRRSLGFMMAKKLLTLFCVGSVLLSALPGYLWNKAASESQYVLSWRHEGSKLDHSAGVSLDTINAGGILGAVTFGGLFSDLDQSRHLMFYVSIFVYIAMILSVFNNLNRRLILIFGVGFMLVLISMSDMAPVHKFLYEHVFFFRLFRNIFYLLYMAIPFIILFTVEQFYIFVESKATNRWQNLLMILFCVTANLGFIYFLARIEDVVVTSFITVALSLVLILLFRWKGESLKRVFGFLIVLLVMLQPAQVFYCSVRNSLSTVAWFPLERFKARFSFVRNPQGESVYFKGPTQGIQDHSGIVPWKFVGLPATYQLQANVSVDILEQYTHYKFFVYDRVEKMPDERVDFNRIEKAFVSKENLAFVALNKGQSLEAFPVSGRKDVSTQVEIINGNSPNFEVVSFDVNSIKFKTSFRDWKFLVYTDAFHKNWQAFVNTNKTELFRANFAFKGIWLPPGENTVFLRYGSRGFYFSNYFMLVFFYLFFVYLLWECYRARKGPQPALVPSENV